MSRERIPKGESIMILAGALVLGGAILGLGLWAIRDLL